MITEADSLESAIQVYLEAKSIFKEASMNVREWISSNTEVNKVIDSVDSVCCDKWLIESDSARINPSPQTERIKRNNRFVRRSWHGFSHTSERKGLPPVTVEQTP